jgi:hypothetical protein
MKSTVFWGSKRRAVRRESNYSEEIIDLLVSYLAISSTLKIEAACSSEKKCLFSEVHSVTAQKILQYYIPQLIASPVCVYSHERNTPSKMGLLITCE